MPSGYSSNSHGVINNKLIQAQMMKYLYLSVAKPIGVISATKKLKAHAVPVDIEVMGTRILSGAISLAYKKVKPKKPVKRVQDQEVSTWSVVVFSSFSFTKKIFTRGRTIKRG